MCVPNFAGDAPLGNEGQLLTRTVASRVTNGVRRAAQQVVPRRPGSDLATHVLFLPKSPRTNVGRNGLRRGRVR